MEFISVFDEASRDHEAEDLAAREAAARVDAQEVWPFLALASSPEEFGHRLALAEGRLSGIASRHGLTYEDVTAPLREGFAVLHPRQAGGESCRNCGHANPPHRKGGLCSVCGCESFQPGTHGSRQAARDEDEGTRFSCPDCQGMGMSFDALGKGLTHCSTCADSGSVYRKRKEDSSGGYSHGDFDFTPAPRHTSGLTSFDERIASLRTALVEGQDPLGWLADESAPATPTHHDTTEHLLGNTPVAIDQAMSGGGGSGTPENPGGHSQTQKTTARGDAPFG
jgi:hypothetical protein